MALSPFSSVFFVFSWNRKKTNNLAQCQNIFASFALRSLFFFWNFKITNFQTSNVMIHGRKKREEGGIEELNEEVIIVKEY